MGFPVIYLGLPEVLKQLDDIEADIAAVTGAIAQSVGTPYYVDGISGDDANSGLFKTTAKLTIGAAILTCSAGDIIIIGAAVYNEDVDVNKDSVELWFEIGAIIVAQVGAGLTLSGNYCKVITPDGALRVNPIANGTGVRLTGNWNYLWNTRVPCESSADLGYDIDPTSTGSILTNCRTIDPLIAAFKLQGDRTTLQDCITGGTPADTSIGYWILATVDKIRLMNCASQGHSSGGFVVDPGAVNGEAVNCVSGGGDGPRLDPTHAVVWSNYTFDDLVAKTITLDNSHAYDLFKVTGAVELLDIYGVVETVLVGANTDVYYQLFSAGGVDPITKITDADLGVAPVGTIVIKTEDPGKALKVLSAATPSVEKGTDPKKRGALLVADKDQPTYIKWVCGGNDDTSGEMHHHIKWLPITDGAFVEPV